MTITQTPGNDEGGWSPRCGRPAAFIDAEETNQEITRMRIVPSMARNASSVSFDGFCETSVTT